MGLFSERGKQPPDVYVYDEIPKGLKQQVVLILLDTLGEYEEISRYDAHKINCSIQKDLCLAYKTYVLVKMAGFGNTPRRVMMYYIHRLTDPVLLLDVVELYMQWFKKYEEMPQRFYDARYTPAAAIQKINEVFRENGFGYQFENNQIVRVDSPVLHQELIQPALRLLTDDAYKNANDEMMDAFKHLKKGEYAPAMVEAVKALESVLKIICDKHKWQVERGASSSKLFKAVFDNGLLPSYLQDQFNKLQNLLQGLLIGGAPALRNQPNAAHGGGLDGTEIPEYVAAYCIQTAAAAIVFLVNADKDYDNR